MRPFGSALLALLSVLSIHAQESAFERLSLNKLNSAFNHGDHVQVEHGTGKVLFTYDFRCELSSRGMVFRPRVIVQPAAKTISLFSGQSYEEFNNNYSAFAVMSSNLLETQRYIKVDEFNTAENILFVNRNGQFVNLAPNHLPAELGRAFSFNADPSSATSISPGFGTWGSSFPTFFLPNGRVVPILGEKANAQDFSPLFQGFGYSLNQLSWGGFDNLPESLRANCFKLDSGGVGFYLKDDNGKEGFPPDLSYYGRINTVDGIPRDGWLPALVLIVIGNEAYEYELAGVIGAHEEPHQQQVPGEDNGVDKFADIFSYRLRKIKNKFGDSIKFDYDMLDIGYSAKLYIDGIFSGKSIDLVFQGLIGGVNPSLFGHLNSGSAMNADKILNLSLRSNANGITLKTYAIRAAARSVDIEDWPGGSSMDAYGNFSTLLPNEKPTPNKRQKLQFLSIYDEDEGLQCDIQYTWLNGTLPFGPGLGVGAVGINSIQFSNGLKYQFTYKPDLYCANYESWWGDIISREPSNFFPGMSWGVADVKKTDTITGETRTTTYDRRLPAIAAASDPTSGPTIPTWSSLDFWEKETYSDGSGVKRVFASPIPGYSGRGPNPEVVGWIPDSYEIRLKMYLFKKAALQREEYFDKNGVVYKTVAYDTWENRNLANPDADPAKGMEPFPTRTVVTMVSEGVADTKTFTAWDAVNIGWTRLNQTISSPVGSFDRSVSWTLQSNPTFGLFGLQQREVRPGYPAITRTFDSTGLVTSEQVDGGTVQIKKDFQIVQGRIKGFTLSGTGLSGSPTASSLTYDHDALGYMNKIQAGNGLLTYLRDYDTEGRPIKDTDPNGFAVTYQWDGASRLKGVTPSGEVSSLIDYPSDLRSLNLTRGQSNESRRFNAFGELVSVQLPGGTKTFRYDSLGRKTFESVIGGSQGTAFTFDARGRLNGLTDPNGLATTYGYTGLTKTAATAGETTSFTSDALGRLVTVVDPKGQTTEYGYDTGDRLTSVKQYGVAGTQTRSWAYNALGWVTSLTQPESGTTTYSNFNVFGKPATTSYAGRIVNTTFDALGRVTDVNAVDGSVAQHFAFDGGVPFNGKLRTATDQGVQLDYGYGGLNGRMDSLRTTLTGPVSGMTVPPFTQSFTYDTYGNRASATLPSGRTVNYTYDLFRGVLQEVDAGSGAQGSFGALVAVATVPTFNPANSPMKLLLANGASTTFTYSADQIRLTSMSHAYPLFAGSTGRTWNYAWDPATGRLNGDGEDTYKYEDKLGRLTEATYCLPTSQGGTLVTQRFAYDPFGNQTSSTFPTGVPSQLQGNLVPWTMNATEIAQMAMTNQLPATTGGVLTGAQYDPQGNLTRINKRPSGPQVSLAYDALGRVTQMMDSELGTTEKYFYTPEGLRTRTEVYQGVPPGTLVLQKVKINVYNDQRQLVTELEAN